MALAILVFAALAFLGSVFTLAYAAEDVSLLRVLVYAGFAVADCLSILLWLAYTGVFVTGAAVDFSAPESSMPMLHAIIGVSPVLLTLSVVALLLLIPPLRRPLARLIPIDPDRVVHAVAIQLAILLLAVSTVTAATTSAIGSDTEALNQLAGKLTGAGALLSAWGQALGFVVLAALGTGLLVRRSPRDTLERLGVTRSVSLKWFAIVVAGGLISGWVVDGLWHAIDPTGAEQVSRISEALFQGFIDLGWIGALTVGLSAGLGEELVFRGALQPRFGIALTSFLFAALHTQYTVSPALLQVFFLAVLLGLARVKSSTTTCMLAHATYNTILVLLAIYAPNAGP